MASNIRKGKVPHRPTGLGDGVDEIYSLKGFFGEWAHLYRRNNLAHPLRWSDARLMYSGLDGRGLTVADATDPRGAPLRLLEGDGVAVSLSRRSAPMPFSEKNVDRHQIRFYDRGAFLVETELGPLEVRDGDFVVIPRGMIFRETPRASEGNAVYVFETEATVQLAEAMWDSVGYASLFVDYSQMEIPEPEDRGDEGRADGGEPEEYELRVLHGGETLSMHYDFDPCRDVVGWVGDPVIFKMSVWDVPAPATSHGHLPPPASAVLMGEDKAFFFNALSMPPSPTVRPPDGSFGPPSHLNDYDELWLTHLAPHAPHTEGHLWLLPRTLPHPGMRGPHGPPPRKEPIRSMRVNFDTAAELRWTDEATAALFEDPVLAQYTSFFGVPLEAVPEKLRRRAAGG
jgi:homogentisate 1,2-dioxygenase